MRFSPMRNSMVRSALMLCSMLAAAPVLAAQPPSRYGVDAPELARLGEFAVGYRIMRLIQREQIDVLSFDAERGTAARSDRELTVDLWYPAKVAGKAPVVYAASLPGEQPGSAVPFSVPGIAVRDAPRRGADFPLIVVSHGYSNDPAAMTWLTENLASKGYVVASIRHADPPITDASRRSQPLLRRPLDIAFVTASLRKTLGAEHLVDPSRTALIGYSMGGYGVLTAAGALLDPSGPLTRLVPGDLLQPYVRGGALQDSVMVKGLRAVIAISPAGGGTLAAWGANGLMGIQAPLLLIAGDADRTVDYASGARAMFDAARTVPRYLLTFKGAGHSIGLNPAPESMRSRLWDQDWFEDPVWRKERINAINVHFITAFLDRYVKGDATRAAYLDVAETNSAAGVWPAAPAAAYDAYSPGTPEITVWKGFQRHHAEGLELLSAPGAQ
jgi:predicted dienelactone hydrolase